MLKRTLMINRPTSRSSRSSHENIPKRFGIRFVGAHRAHMEFGCRLHQITVSILCSRASRTRCGPRIEASPAKLLADCEMTLHLNWPAAGDKVAFWKNQCLQLAVNTGEPHAILGLEPGCASSQFPQMVMSCNDPIASHQDSLWCLLKLPFTSNFESLFRSLDLHLGHPESSNKFDIMVLLILMLLCQL